MNLTMMIMMMTTMLMMPTIKNVKEKQKEETARIIRSVWFNKETEPEKHYRELIMLFTSWRNEDTDLLGNCSSYQDYFSLIAHSGAP